MLPVYTETIFMNEPVITTTRTDDLQLTATFDPELPLFRENELVPIYENLLGENKVSWTSHLRFQKCLGSGGQGVVFLTERRGADGFTLPVAVKIFSPERFPSPEAYEEGMARIARVSAMIAKIQHDNLLMVQNFVDRNRIRMLTMEWVEGFDLRKLMNPQILDCLKTRVSAARWKKLNEVVVTYGPKQSRFKPGIAVAIVRHCLAALAALHREGIVHGDIKPANIMVKRSGIAKIIDYGSASEIVDPPKRRSCTPTYAAIEVLENQDLTPRSDLASIGYVLVELLAGRPLFDDSKNLGDLIEAKRNLPKNLASILPDDIARNELLMKFFHGLIAPDPADRFWSAEDAELREIGAVAFHRQLIKVDLASEYDIELRVWIEELLEMFEEQPS